MGKKKKKLHFLTTNLTLEGTVPLELRSIQKFESQGMCKEYLFLCFLVSKIWLNVG